MTTFKAIFTKEPVLNHEEVDYRQYTFNTKDKVEIGDFFYSKVYNKHLQVVFVFSKPHEYVNVKTGELSNEQHSFPYVKIKEIPVNEDKSQGATNDENQGVADGGTGA